MAISENQSAGSQLATQQSIKTIEFSSQKLNFLSISVTCNKFKNISGWVYFSKPQTKTAPNLKNNLI
jgi:hypothetical protein